MRAPSTLSREQFEKACKSFISDSGVGLEYLPQGWAWTEHPRYAGLGFMQRITTIRSRVSCDSQIDTEIEDELEDIYDPAVFLSGQLSDAPIIKVYESVVLSTTFKVPAFYFSAFREDGTPLDLGKIIGAGYLRGTVDGVDSSSNSVMLPSPNEEAATFPLLSQGDHPVLGTSSWYLHPCNMAHAMRPLLDDIVGDEWVEDKPDRGLFRWLSTWFMIINSAVNIVQLSEATSSFNMVHC
ncbi:uncharacterized protein EI90DRAFT_3065944 [Cantharellus anzutake]|uniref:uncharacterized protein n=1 Tax=Cantharellus anzutake TaxID=1750568 RepID=UPI0019089794|nr:uncharacterized protein EI90DRAFT_3065944 [Cantharellus anzutake]KAF8328233.1 hypothetical protein EI90DRAFT_3065944 [Cantharellus anzutake]